MKIVQVEELQQSPTIYNELAEILHDDGIVCFPTATSYRLVTNMMSEKAIINFQQIKRRTRKAPVLLFVPNQHTLSEIVAEVPEGARRLIEVFWPGPLTLQFALHPDLPRKILKNLNCKGKVGIRIPQDPIANNLLQAFGGPLLVSSANISRKKGAHSEAQIRKNFGRWVDVLISTGDVKGDGSSTVLDVTSDPPVIRRQGLVDGDEVLRVWSSDVPPGYVESTVG